jgi:preprotein translocase subunit SecE
MNVKNEGSNNILDLIKWMAVIALIAVGVIGNSYYANESLLYRVLALLGLSIFALAIVSQTIRGAAFLSLVKEAKAEIRKVVWPTPQETHQTTLIVVAVVLIAGLMLWGIDSGLSWVISKIIG